MTPWRDYVTRLRRATIMTNANRRAPVKTRSLVAVPWGIWAACGVIPSLIVAVVYCVNVCAEVFVCVTVVSVVDVRSIVVCLVTR